jgi:hypothetical protein
MSLAKFRKVHSKTGAGRFVVSEGIAPAAYLLPHPGLPTWNSDSEDDRFEIVITKGTILSVVADANGDARIVPANGSASSQGWGDVMPSWDPLDGATPSSTTGSVDTISVGAYSVPIGCAQYDLYRPFDKGTSQGAGFITHGYVEYPMVAQVNADVTVGSLIRADHMGRPVAFAATTAAAGVSRVSATFDLYETPTTTTDLPAIDPPLPAITRFTTYAGIVKFTSLARLINVAGTPTWLATCAK